MPRNPSLFSASLIFHLPSPIFHSLVMALGSVSPLAAQVSVLTQHNDNARTGLNASETLLTQANVNTNWFGKLFSKPVDGPVYPQPLYVPNVAFPNQGTHNVVFVATQHDSVYAFDADSNVGTNASPLWHDSFINPAAGIIPVTTADVGGCPSFVGEIGIVGTPVIDAASGTLYVVALTKELTNQTYVLAQRLHALDITTGNERSNSPVVIEASVPGTGDGSSGGMVRFDPARELQRSGLLLAGGVVYIAWASYCDNDPYHGWILGYDPRTLAQVSAFNVTPNGSKGGIWMAGAGLSATADGTLYCVTGNGTFDTKANPTNFGDSFLKLQATNLTLLDYFTPFNQATLNSDDIDLGSGGAVLLPDSVGSVSHPHLLVGCSKEGKLYLLDRDNLGHYNSANDSQIVQEFSLGSTVFGLPAYFNGRLYIQAVGQFLKAFAFSNGQFNTAPVSQTTEQVTFRGTTPSISANDTTDGIVWLLAPTPTPGVTTLRAYNADNLSQKLYDSYTSMPANSSNQISFVKFVVPTIANGKVYVGTANALAVFGLWSRILSITRDRVSGSVHLVYVPPTGGTNIVQVSEDIVHWTDLGPGTPTGNGSSQYTDSTAAGRPTRFYRLR